MENDSIVKKTGPAFIWKAIQLGGTKAIYFLRTLLLSYVLLPSEFGLFAVTLIAVDFLVNVTNFGIVSALVQQTDPTEKQYDSAWTFNLIRGAGISVLVFLFASLIAQVFNNPEAAHYIRFAALKPLLDSCSSIKVVELIRNLKFRELSYLKLSEAVFSTIFSLLLALLFGVAGLLVGILSGSLISSVLSFVLAPHKPKFSLNIEALKPIIHFSKWIYYATLVSAVGSISIQIMITRELGLTELGLYYLALHLAFLPSELVTEIFGAVMFPVFAGLQGSKEKLTSVYKSFVTNLLVIILPGCILFLFITPHLVQYVLSSKWNGTVEIIQILAMVNIIGLIGESAVPLFSGTGRTKIIFMLDALQSTLLISFCLIFINYWGINGAAAAWIPAIFVSQFFTFYYLSRVLIKPFHGIPSVIFSVSLSSIISTAVGIIVTVHLTGLAGFIIGFFSSLLLIAFSMLLTDNYFKLGIRHNLAAHFLIKF